MRLDGIALRRRMKTRANTTVIVLLSLILIALLVLIGVIIYDRPPQRPLGSGGIANGETATRDPSKRPSAKPIADPNLIKETLKVGRTYRAVLKVGLTARAEDSDWGVTAVTSLAYLGEMVVNRNIESNDGQRVVELRHFESCVNAKLLAKMEDLKIDLGLPSEPMLKEVFLQTLQYKAPGSRFLIQQGWGMLKKVVISKKNLELESDSQKTFGCVDSLSGKKIRITYVDDEHAGVESLQPIDCSLSIDEKNFLWTTAVLSDCHLMNRKVAPGDQLNVDAAQLGGFFDPSLRAVVSGKITLLRRPNDTDNGADCAVLQVGRERVTLESTDESKQLVGSFVPDGRLYYNLADNYVQRGELTGDFSVEHVSKHHLLFTARMRTQPVLQITYSCQLQ